MAAGKKRSEQHLIDQDGIALLRSKLPRAWVLREYRPDYGLDFTIEPFKDASGTGATYETLGEHFFVQLKSVADPAVHKLDIYGRGNVEKAPEELNRADKVATIDSYRLQLEMSELVTIERMGIGVPVLLVIADLARQRCSFVCLNDYIDKILIPQHDDYRTTKSRTIHVPLWTELGSAAGTFGLRWYAKRAKLLAAFQRFTYQYSELQWHEHEDWRGLARYFGERIVQYDFWDDTEMCAPIPYHAAGLRRFLATGQPGYFKVPADIEPGVDPAEWKAYFEKLDVFELWRSLSLLPKTYEDVWREWFLPTALGQLASAPG
ncbi:MAG: hypothetical protein BGN95_11525 [Sphingomonas sp. 66-10]|uniref:DUF4365 domain-containing protein n=1 Tax=Sphingomonas sp. 66-10 TaxID=1895848 RepID=UPI00092C3D21|nr:DUF4365 domain-containing protein [Sphingomonas sp. 66-10]OJU15986.1 MAG: hypothetical protein BGN95_11525 [Sphingomonas sp. 66-10]